MLKQLSGKYNWKDEFLPRLQKDERSKKGKKKGRAKLGRKPRRWSRSPKKVW